MSHTGNQNNFDFIIDPVNNSIVSNPKSIQVITSFEFDRSCGTWILFESINRNLQTLFELWGKLTEFLGGRGLKFDVIHYLLWLLEEVRLLALPNQFRLHLV